MNMEILLSENDARLLKLAYMIIEKWRTIMNIDPIWQIDIQVLPDEEIEGSIAYINMSRAANYYAQICISYYLFSYEDADFLSEIETIACHELTHLVAEDFMRTAILAAGHNRKLVKELRHKYEQFTSRLQKTMLDLVKKENE
jgi:hypothetical protein